jgi:hypothetical protein
MIDIKEINSEIAKLENMPISYQTIERLAWLYIVRDHAEHPVIKCYGDSDCMKACSGKPVDQIMLVVDDLMDTLQVIQPRLYNAVMDKLI